jgi:hypothetical protein
LATLEQPNWAVAVFQFNEEQFRAYPNRMDHDDPWLPVPWEGVAPDIEVVYKKASLKWCMIVAKSEAVAQSRVL